MAFLPAKYVAGRKNRKDSDLKLESKQGVKRKIEYKWVIGAIGFLMVFICLGFCSSPKSLFVSAITEALDIKRSLFSINDTCRHAANAIVNIFFGFLVNKFGTKKLICAGFIALIASCLVYAVATQIWMFYLGGTLLGIGLSWTTTTMVGCIINRWYKENTGTVMGAVLAANGIGGTVATQILSPIIYQEGNPFGFRQAYLLITAILVVMGILVVVFYRETPKGEDANAPVQMQKKKKRGGQWRGIPFVELVHMPYFYAAILCISVIGMAIGGVNTIYVVHLKDIGFDPSFVAIVMSCHTLLLTVYKLATGVIYDKRGLRTIVNICTISGIVLMAMLFSVTVSPTGKIIALLYGVFSSVALPIDTVLLPIITGDMFGQHSFEKVLGIVVSFHVAGSAIASPLINLVFDITGSYRPAILACMVVLAIGTVAMQFLMTSASKKRALVEKEMASE